MQPSCCQGSSRQVNHDSRCVKSVFEEINELLNATLNKIEEGITIAPCNKETLCNPDQNDCGMLGNSDKGRDCNISTFSDYIFEGQS